MPNFQGLSLSNESLHLKTRQHRSAFCHFKLVCLIYMEHMYPFCLTSSQYNVSGIHPPCCMYQESTPFFRGSSMPLLIIILAFHHLLMDICFQLWDIINEGTMNICVLVYAKICLYFCWVST